MVSRALEQNFDALLLRALPLSEYDEIFTVFTKQKGKLTLTAKATRKPTSKLRHVLLVPSEAYIRAVGKAGFFRIIGAQSRVTWPAKSHTPLQTLPWYWITELVVRGMPEEEPSAEIYELIKDILQIAPTVSNSAQSLSLACLTTLEWLRAAGVGILTETDDMPNEVKGILITLKGASVYNIDQFSDSDERSLKATYDFLAKYASNYTHRSFRTLEAWKTGNVV